MRVQFRPRRSVSVARRARATMTGTDGEMKEPVASRCSAAFVSCCLRISRRLRIFLSCTLTTALSGERKSGPGESSRFGSPFSSPGARCSRWRARRAAPGELARVLEEEARARDGVLEHRDH